MESGSGAQKRVLIVEDDECMRCFCLDALDNAGFSVAVSPHGLDALEKLSKAGFDLIITDIRMPGLGGIDLYSLSLRRYPGLKDRFLFMSGDIWSHAADMLKAGISLERCISKPFAVDEFIDHVNIFIERQKDTTAKVEKSVIKE